MAGLLERITEHSFYRRGLEASRAAWHWLKEGLWPVYSVGMVVSAICIIAAAQEKQTLADHLYGANTEFRDDNLAVSTRSAKLFKEESAVAVKQEVWSLSKEEFEAEYNQRIIVGRR